MKRIFCVYAVNFALFSFLSILLGEVFCRISISVFCIYFLVSPFIALKLGKAVLRDSLIAVTFALTAVLIAYFVTIPQISDAQRLDGKYVKATGCVKSVSFSDVYAIAVVDCDTIDGESSSQKITAIMRREYSEGIDLGTKISFGGKLEFEDSFYNRGKECFLTVFPSYCKLEGTDGLLGSFAYNIRNRIRTVADGMKNSAMIKGLLISDKSEITPEIESDFKKIGTSHILAISGLHLSILVMTLYSIITRIGIPNKTASLLCTLLSLLYMLMTGFSLSLVRAAQMMSVFFIAKLIRRKNDGVTSLFFAGCTILAISQWAMFNLGFLLSFFSTFGILVFVRPISQAYRKHYADMRERGKTFSRRQNAVQYVTGMLINSCATTVAATVFTLPIVLLTFNEVSLFSVFGNLIIVPIAKYFLISSFAAVLLQCVGVNIIAYVFTAFSSLTGDIMLTATKLLGSIAPETVSVRPFYLTMGGIITIVVALFFLFKSRNWWSLPLLTAVFIMFIPTFNLVSDGLIYDTAVIDAVSRSGVHTAVVRLRGETYLLDQTASNSKKMGDIGNIILNDHISYVDKAVFITHDGIIDERVSAFLSVVDIGEIIIFSDSDIDVSELRVQCERKGVSVKTVYGSKKVITDGITAYCREGTATAFVIKNGLKSLSIYRAFTEDGNIRDILTADTLIYFGKYPPSDVVLSSEGHYRLHA